MNNLFLFLFLFIFVLLGLSYKRNKTLNLENKNLIEKNVQLSSKLDTTIHQKKSSEVRLGKIGENMAPFFKAWPYDPNKFRFIGDPIDGISFNENEVVFVEIKTGKARLTTSQRLVKELIRDGKVRFATFRVSEDDCTLKVEEK